MLRKFSFVAAFVAAAATALFVPAKAEAGGRVYRGEPYRGEPWRGEHWRDEHWRGDHWRGYHGRGHWYRGRWWAYGEGPCWRRTPVGWVWICE